MKQIYTAMQAGYVRGLAIVESAGLSRVIGFLLFGMISRLLPHPPNFTAMNALALFGVSFLGNMRSVLTAILIILFLGDVSLGFYPSMIFVYLSFGLIAFIGQFLTQSARSFEKTAFLLVLSSSVFFLMTNFGVWWMESMYPKDLMGLQLCYLAAVPFFVNNLLSTLLYGGLFYMWIGYEERLTPVCYEA